MILCNKRKLGIFLVPRTGTTSICKHFESYEFMLNDHEHITYLELAVPDKKSYKFFAFYRDPVERFLSGMRLLKAASKTKPELAPSTDDPLEFLLNIRDINRQTLFIPQVQWLDYPTVHALSFRTYVSCFSMICHEFGVEIPKQIPWHNQASGDLKYGREFIAKIYETYADDYAFFENNGLTI